MHLAGDAHVLGIGHQLPLAIRLGDAQLAVVQRHGLGKSLHPNGDRAIAGSGIDEVVCRRGSTPIRAPCCPK